MLTVKRMFSYISSPETYMHLFVVTVNICCVREYSILVAKLNFR